MNAYTYMVKPQYWNDMQFQKDCSLKIIDIKIECAMVMGKFLFSAWNIQKLLC